MLVPEFTDAMSLILDMYIVGQFADQFLVKLWFLPVWYDWFMDGSCNLIPDARLIVSPFS